MVRCRSRYRASASAISASAPASASTSPSSSATSTVSAPPAGSSPVGDIDGPAVLYEPLLTVSFTVQSTGDVAGHEVSRLYLDFPAAYAEPPRLLRGFARTLLNRGQRQTVRLARHSSQAQAP
ncbi:hypothetical protein DFH09DRAFT_1305967 [Mycena vulgaris]|nr:hypothetical protein DFH09DRAFT_1305967 [Mycena vulgaris]